MRCSVTVVATVRSANRQCRRWRCCRRCANRRELYLTAHPTRPAGLCHYLVTLTLCGARWDAVNPEDRNFGQGAAQKFKSFRRSTNQAVQPTAQLLRLADPSNPDYNNTAVVRNAQVTLATATQTDMGLAVQALPCEPAQASGPAAELCHSICSPAQSSTLYFPLQLTFSLDIPFWLNLSIPC